MSGSLPAAQAAAEVLAPIGDVTLKRFFGGWALRADGRQFAIVMDVLYLRVDDALRAELEELGSHPFSYQARDRTIQVRRYWSAPAVDEGELRTLAERALEAARE